MAENFDFDAAAGGMMEDALKAMKENQSLYNKHSQYTLRGRNEALGEDKDLAHEGFGTYEDKFAKKPLIGELPTANIIKEEVMQWILPNRTTSRRMVLGRKFLFIGAEFDLTDSVLNDKIPLMEIESIHFQPSDSTVLVVETAANGFNSGRMYYFRPPSTSLHSWLEEIRDASDKAREHKLSRIRRFRKWTMRAYGAKYIQSIVSVLIICNFVTIASEAQMQPGPDTDLYKLMRQLDVAFTVLFTAEIILNGFAHWFWPFVRNWWNLLDIVVVFFSLLTLLQIEALSVLEPTRAFRIFRLAGKVEQLRRIVNAVSSAMSPMANALLIGLIMTSIFAVLGTEFYKDRDPQNFGTFSRTFYSLWLAIAFQVWQDESLPIFREDRSIDFGVLGYLIALVFVLVWIMLQVVVATLLDNFVAATTRAFQTESMERLDAAESMNIDTGGLEPLLGEIIKLFDTSDQLSRGFKKIFHKLDFDRTGRVDYAKMREGMKKIHTKRQIQLSEEDYNILVENGKMCFEDATINVSQFDRIMRKQLKMHVQRDLTDVMAMYDEMVEMRTLLASHRILHLNDPTEYVKKIREQKELFTRDMQLFKRKLQADIDTLIGLQGILIKKTAASLSRSVDVNQGQPLVAELNIWESEELMERADHAEQELGELRKMVMDLASTVEANAQAATAASTARNTPYTGKSSAAHSPAPRLGDELEEPSEVFKPAPVRGHFNVASGNHIDAMQPSPTTLGTAGRLASGNAYKPLIPENGYGSGPEPLSPPRDMSRLQNGSKGDSPPTAVPRRNVLAIPSMPSLGRNGAVPDEASANSRFLVPKVASARTSRSETRVMTSRGVVSSLGTAVADGSLGFPGENNVDRAYPQGGFVPIGRQ